MTAFTLTISDLTAHANSAKEVTLSALVADGYLTSEQADQFAEKYVILVSQKNMLGRIFDKIFSSDKENVVRFIALKKVGGK